MTLEIEANDGEHTSSVDMVQTKHEESTNEEAWKEQDTLRYAHPVQEILEAFWSTTLESEHFWHTGELNDVTLPTIVCFHGYRHLYQCIYTVLIEEWDVVKGEATIREDWAHDVTHGEVLQRTSFEDVLLELADLWTKRARADEYASFLWSLYRRITMPYKSISTLVQSKQHRLEVTDPPRMVWKGFEDVEFDDRHHQRHKHHNQRMQNAHAHPRNNRFIAHLLRREAVKQIQAHFRGKADRRRVARLMRHLRAGDAHLPWRIKARLNSPRLRQQRLPQLHHASSPRWHVLPPESLIRERVVARSFDIGIETARTRVSRTPRMEATAPRARVKFFACAPLPSSLPPIRSKVFPASPSKHLSLDELRDHLTLLSDRYL